ncbi:hypothetical protein FQN57_005869 [Myotisia sp. PD_48]|nr:hypothetical protein FQN57_005869 [Myotisia sp. PD_48]
MTDFIDLKKFSSRQEGLECKTNEGLGTCRPSDDCGKFHPGTAPPYPCPGPSDIQCCVVPEDEDDESISTRRPTSASNPGTRKPTNTGSITTRTPTENSTSTTNPPTTRIVTSISASTITFDGQSSITSSPSGSPLTAPTTLSPGSIGGIVVGTVGGIALIVIAITLLLMRRKRKSRHINNNPVEGNENGSEPSMANKIIWPHGGNYAATQRTKGGDFKLPVGVEFRDKPNPTVVGNMNGLGMNPP